MDMYCCCFMNDNTGRTGQSKTGWRRQAACALAAGVHAALKAEGTCPLYPKRAAQHMPQRGMGRRKMTLWENVACVRGVSPPAPAIKQRGFTRRAFSLSLKPPTSSLSRARCRPLRAFTAAHGRWNFFSTTITRRLIYLKPHPHVVRLGTPFWTAFTNVRAASLWPALFWHAMAFLEQENMSSDSSCVS